LLPRTKLLQAPGDLANTFGQGIHSDDLIRGLRKANLRISVPAPDVYGWYPGKAAGMTSIWLGPPSELLGRKICAFHLGMVPEFTQVDHEGEIIRRGWRSVMQKVMGIKAAPKARLERIFKVDLSIGESERACPKCRELGKYTPDVRGSGYCDFHHYPMKLAATQHQINKEILCQQ